MTHADYDPLGHRSGMETASDEQAARIAEAVSAGEPGECVLLRAVDTAKAAATAAWKAERRTMCNRARMSYESEALWGSAANLFGKRLRDNRFDPRELRPRSRNYVIREQGGGRAWDVMTWDVLDLS